MEPLLDKLARQEPVKRFFGAIRSWDRRSDQWMLSKPRKWRILLLAITAGLTVPVAVLGWMGALLAILVLYLCAVVFLPANFCLILAAKRSVTFKLVNLGIFATYLVPLGANLFYSDKFLDNFPFTFFLFPIAMLLHSIYLIFAWRRIRESTARKAVKFVVSMLVMGVICSIVWDNVVMENLYNDTDDNMFGFLTPGGWVSNWDGRHPIVQVDHIVHAGNMSDPDTIKKGWTVTDLWLIWLSFVAVSVMISSAAAWFPWIPKRFSGRHFSSP